MRLAAAFLAAVLALPAAAQDRDETLADIRQELSVLQVELQRLNRELVTTGAPGVAQPSGDLLRRVETIESELSRLTAATEALTNRVNRVVADGTNQIDDLKFRLCELTPKCDLGAIPPTAPLGGDTGAVAPPSPPSPIQPGPELAVGERADFDAAKAAFESGSYQDAADRLSRFAEAYPGSPLGAEAAYLRGQSLDALGQTASAARAYLDSFSGTPDGAVAPDALFRLGLALEKLGQRQEACVTLGEVSNRFPGSAADGEAQSARAQLACQ